MPSEWAVRVVCPVSEVGVKELMEIVRWVAKIGAKLEIAASASFLRQNKGRSWIKHRSCVLSDKTTCLAAQ